MASSEQAQHTALDFPVTNKSNEEPLGHGRMGKSRNVQLDKSFDHVNIPTRITKEYFCSTKNWSCFDSTFRDGGSIPDTRYCCVEFKCSPCASRVFSSFSGFGIGWGTSLNCPRCVFVCGIVPCYGLAPGPWHPKSSGIGSRLLLMCETGRMDGLFFVSFQHQWCNL